MDEELDKIQKNAEEHEEKNIDVKLIENDLNYHENDLIRISKIFTQTYEDDEILGGLSEEKINNLCQHALDISNIMSYYLKDCIKHGANKQLIERIDTLRIHAMNIACNIAFFLECKIPEYLTIAVEWEAQKKSVEKMIENMVKSIKNLNEVKIRGEQSTIGDSIYILKELINARKESNTKEDFMNTQMHYLEVENLEELISDIELAITLINNVRTDANKLRAKSEKVKDELASGFGLYIENNLDKDFFCYYEKLKKDFCKMNDMVEEQDKKLWEKYAELQNILQPIKQRVEQVKEKRAQRNEKLKRIPGYTKLQDLFSKERLKNMPGYTTLENMYSKTIDVTADKIVDIMYHQPGQLINNIGSKDKNNESRIEKPIRLFGKKIVDIKQILENKINSYAKENKSDILKKSKEILKKDKNKKIGAIITAIAVSGAIGDKVYNQMHGKLSQTNDVSQVEQIPQEVDIASEPINNDNIEEKIYMPYSVDAPGLRLRAKPSVETGEVLATMQNGDTVYVYESDEILNPYDTHEWRNVIYESVDEVGKISLISGYIDINYLKENPNCNEYIVIDEDVDLSTVNINDIKYSNAQTTRNANIEHEEEANR